LDYFVYLAPVKSVWAINPAIGAKKKMLPRRMSVNCQPNIPTSSGNLWTPKSDHAVK